MNGNLSSLDRGTRLRIYCVSDSWKYCIRMDYDELDASKQAVDVDAALDRDRNL